MNSRSLSGKVVYASNVKYCTDVYEIQICVFILDGTIPPQAGEPCDAGKQARTWSLHAELWDQTHTRADYIRT
jgi:hypothetical protein